VGGVCVHSHCDREGWVGQGFGEGGGSWVGEGADGKGMSGACWQNGLQPDRCTCARALCSN
jgi:hypothetical protein